MKKISIVSPCFNEEDNVAELVRRVRQVFESLPQYDYEIIFIDNASKDRTVPILREMAAQDRRIKVIVNTRNFGHIRSPHYGFLQAHGDAAIMMVSDLQDPPELIPQFIERWEAGFKVVLGIKAKSEESPLFFLMRKIYYSLVNRLADVELIKNATGFGLYDQEVVRQLRLIEDPYPYARGLVAELGYECAFVPFTQPRRQRNITKNNFYTLFDMAMLGFTSHSKVPLRLATMAGFILATCSLLIAAGYFAYKLVRWNSFEVGMAPIVIGLFFFASVQLFFLGIVGEYVGAIYTQVRRRPLVVEKERINFDRTDEPEEHPQSQAAE
jgi:polyisoprenyl-phosphate glycosyltransferase